MRQLKRFFLMCACVGVILGVTACGERNAKDNAANQSENAENTGEVNDATEKGSTQDSQNTTKPQDTGNSDRRDKDDGKGVVDDIGDDVKKGAEDIKDDLEE